MPNLSLAPSITGGRNRPPAVIAESPAMRSLLHHAERVAPTDLAVLLHGETGTGKDVLARHIHEHSGRPGSFIAINCAALPSGLAESELFGHVRGAFTGAERLREGIFEQAHRGTLLLDEIGDLDLAVQGKLLRVLEDGVVQRLGSSGLLTVDVRIIAATHRNLHDAVWAGRFREDLLHRLAGITFEVPPLRERQEDISLLVEHFLAETEDGAGKTISSETLTWLERQTWPGNAREIRQAVRRAVALGGHELLPADFVISNAPPSITGADRNSTAGRRWAEIERDTIADALRRHGSLRAAARALGRAKSTLADRARIYNLSTNQLYHQN